MSVNLPLKILASVAGADLVIRQMHTLSKAISGVATAQQRQKATAAEMARGFQVTERTLAKQLQKERFLTTGRGSMPTGPDKLLDDARKKSMLSPVFKAFPALKSATRESGEMRLRQKALDDARKALTYSRQQKKITADQLNQEESTIQAKIVAAQKRGKKEIALRAIDELRKFRKERTEVEAMGDAEQGAIARKERRAAGKLAGTSTLRGAAFGAVAAHPVIAGAVAGAAIITGAVAGVVLFNQKLEKLALSFAGVRGSQAGMMASLKDARNIYKDTTLTLEDSIKVVNAFAYAAQAGRVNIADMGKTVERLGYSFGMTTEAAITLMKAVSNTGNLRGVREQLGMSKEQMTMLLKMSGKEADFSDPAAAGKTVQEAIRIRSSGADRTMDASLTTIASKSLKKLNVWIGNRVSAMYSGALKAATDTATGASTVQTRKEERAATISAEASNYQNLLEEQANALKEQSARLDGIRSQWAAILSNVHQYRNNLLSMRESIRRGSFQGGTAEFGAARGFLQQARQAKEYEGGAIKNPEAAFRYYQQSLSGVTGLMDKFKAMQMRVTGQTAFGEYSGSHATGREAYLLRQEQAHIKKGFRGSLVSELGKTDDPNERALLKGMGRAIDSGSPEALDTAMQEYAKFISDKAEKAANKQIEIQQLQQQTLEKTYEMEKGFLSDILISTRNLSDEFAKLSPEAQAMVSKDPTSLRNWMETANIAKKEALLADDEAIKNAAKQAAEEAEKAKDAASTASAVRTGKSLRDSFGGVGIGSSGNVFSGTDAERSTLREEADASVGLKIWEGGGSLGGIPLGKASVKRAGQLPMFNQEEQDKSILRIIRERALEENKEADSRISDTERARRESLSPEKRESERINRNIASMEAMLAELKLIRGVSSRTADAVEHAVPQDI